MQVVGKIGPLEYILNTPSHHRVHHAVNRYCIDKNYAGVFIVWDRLFGMRVCYSVPDRGAEYCDECVCLCVKR